MKRILALLLSIVMLLGACAFAEQTDASHRYALSDIVLTYGETTIDLSNVSLALDVVDDGPAVLAHLDADGVPAAEIGITKVDGLDVLHMAGALSGHKDFVVDPVLQAEKVIKRTIDGLVEALQSVDTHAAAEKFVEFLESPKTSAQPEPEEEIVAEETPVIDENSFNMTGLTIEGDVRAALLDCVTSEDGAEIDGSAGIPAGTYDVDRFYIDEAALAGILDMVYLNGEPSGMGDKLRESGTSVQLSGEKYAGEGVEAVNLDVGMEYGGEDFGVHVDAVKTVSESGSVTTCEFSVEGGGTAAGLKFTASEEAGVESAFTPASVDLTSAVDLDGMTDEDAFAALSEAFQMLGTDAIIPIAGPFMEVMMAGVDMEAFQTELDAAAQ